MAPSVKIDRVRLLEISLPLKVPFRISGGVMRVRRSILVELLSDGAVGRGESAPFEFPFYSSETTGSVKSLLLELLAPRIEGRSFGSFEEFDAALREGVRGNPFARCGIENAFWDLRATIEGRPLPDLIAAEMERLGVPPEARRPASRIESGVAIGIPETENLAELRRWIEDYRAEGYRRVKIKIRPGWDAPPCRAAREILGPDFPLWPDANASYELDRHAADLAALDEFNLAFLEQPLHHDDLLDHAKLARLVRTPLCLDESLKDARTGRLALECGAARIWNVKVQRMGGLLEAIRVYALAVREGVRLWGGTMPESGIGAQPILALSAFPAFVYPADVEPSGRWYEPETDPLPIVMSPDGFIEVPRTAGLAPLLDMELYGRRAVPFRE